MTTSPFLVAALAMLLRRLAASSRRLAWTVLAAAAVNARAACPLEAPRLRVTDPAGVLGEKSSALADRLAGYQKGSGHQVFLLVVPSLGPDTSIEECAVTVFRRWQLGRKGIDDGVLLLVAVKERKMRIEVGYGLEGTLTDAQSSRIIREVMVPLFARGEYAEGVDRGLDAIIALLGASTPGELSAPPAPSPQHPSDEPGFKAVVGAILLVLLLTMSLMGLLGLLICSVPTNAFAHWIFHDWRAYLLAAVIATAWYAVRWLIIRKNVRKYHLNKSRHKTLIWVWYFLAFGVAAPASTRKAKASRASCGSNDDGGPSFSLSSDSADGGSSWNRRKCG